MENKKSLELKKHVATIHSAGRLTLLQRKIANALLFNAYDELLEKEEHEIHISTLCKLIGYDSNDHKTIKKALVNLLATVIEWNLVDGNKLDTEGIWNASSIIADASIDGPICNYSYSNKMKKLLHRPELYGRLNMLVQSQFQSSYGLALYENCIRFQNIERTPWFEVLKFRKLMGVEESKYKIFRDFKHRVLDKAVEEVNKYSPIFVTPQFQKQKRQVVAIQFLISQRNKVSSIGNDEQKYSASLSDILKLQFGLSKRQVETIISTYDAGYILEKIALIEASPSYLNGKINNLAKYILCALKEDYQPVKKAKSKEHTGRKKANNRMINFDPTKVEEYRRYQNKQIIKIFNQQLEIEKKKILLEFEHQLGKSIYRDIYLRDGLANLLVEDQLCLFIKHKKLEMLREIISYEEFYAIYKKDLSLPDP